VTANPGFKVAVFSTVNQKRYVYGKYFYRTLIGNRNQSVEWYTSFDNLERRVLQSYYSTLNMKAYLTYRMVPCLVTLTDL